MRRGGQGVGLGGGGGRAGSSGNPGGRRRVWSSVQRGWPSSSHLPGPHTSRARPFYVQGGGHYVK